MIIDYGDHIDAPKIRPPDSWEDELRYQSEIMALYQNPDGTLTRMGEISREALRQEILNINHVGEAELIRHE